MRERSRAGSGTGTASSSARDDAAEIHDGDPVGDVPHHGEVVADEEVGEGEALLQVGEEIEDLRLDRDVERRQRLVRHDEARGADRGARDGDALALAAGELVRVATRHRGVEAHHLQDGRDALARLSGAGESVDEERLGQRLADAHARVQRGERVLEHHPHGGTGAAQRFRRQGAEVAAVEQRHAAGRLLQPQKGAAQGGLAAAGFPDERHGFARRDREVDAVDGADARRRGAAHAPPAPPAEREVDPERPGLRHGAQGLPSTRQQAAAARGPVGISGGASAQRAKRSGQRGAKAQPAIGRSGRGGCPGMARARWPRGWSSRATVDSRAAV